MTRSRALLLAWIVITLALPLAFWMGFANAISGVSFWVLVQLLFAGWLATWGAFLRASWQPTKSERRTIARVGHAFALLFWVAALVLLLSAARTTLMG